MLSSTKGNEYGTNFAKKVCYGQYISRHKIPLVPNHSDEISRDIKIMPEVFVLSSRQFTLYALQIYSFVRVETKECLLCLYNSSTEFCIKKSSCAPLGEKTSVRDFRESFDLAVLGIISSITVSLV